MEIDLDKISNNIIEYFISQCSENKLNEYDVIEVVDSVTSRLDEARKILTEELGK